METGFIDYEVADAVATITLNRPEAANAQTMPMLDDLDEAWRRAADDDDVRVIVLQSNGKHFSAGHDIGTPGRDIDQSYDRRAVLHWDHTNKSGGASRMAREAEVYVGMCRRWREIPKPTIVAFFGEGGALGAPPEAPAGAAPFEGSLTRNVCPHFGHRILSPA